MQFHRYAIYYCPPAGPLADFAGRWLGWDCLTGRRRDPPNVTGLPVPIEELTRRPRKYGFHATLKPPFRLAPGTDPAMLKAAVEQLCTTLAPLQLDGLELSRIGSFLTLTPTGDTTPLSNLAARVVRDIDRFRAQPTEAELIRRRKSRLSAQQEKHLANWGYPYVMEEFRFHMTLTGPLPKGGAENVLSALAPHISPLLPRPLIIRDLCLLGEAEDGRFHLIRRYALGS